MVAIGPLKARHYDVVQTDNLTIRDCVSLHNPAQLPSHVDLDDVSLASIVDVDLERLFLVGASYEIVCIAFQDARARKRQLDCASTGHLKVLNAVDFIKTTRRLLIYHIDCLEALLDHSFLLG